MWLLCLKEAIDISSLTETQQTFRAKERRLLADILFSIYYQTTISTQEALAILRLFHDLTTFLKSKNPHDKNELFQVFFFSYIVFFFNF
jgi:Tfp pilus assembly ATPase PilU